MSEYIMQCNYLTKYFGAKTALDHVSLNLRRGKIIGLLGPNGSGKTTLLKTANGLLVPTEGELLIDGMAPGINTKRIVSYLPDQNYLNGSMRVGELVGLFADFYPDFDAKNAYNMLDALHIQPEDKLKTLSKGNREKVQLILVMSRDAQLYLLDEPIGGVDPATRDYILNSIIRNYSENASVVISTHLIADIEPILDEVIFINNGRILLHDSVDNLREQEGKSIDAIFREVFKC